ncbi:TPA: hypothetical protein EYP66_14665 [Candidatus Poribacteria bacterium]|nr:hypothetical protein [Candidatus Poribacteria bacterium]
MRQTMISIRLILYCWFIIIFVIPSVWGGGDWQVVIRHKPEPEPLSHPTTIHIPIEAERNSWIAVGKFVEYTGSEKWRWTITDVKVSEVELIADILGIKKAKKPSFAVTLSFEPYRPEPPSLISSRKDRRKRPNFWAPYPYLNPRVLKKLKGNVTEEISTLVGLIECYKLRPLQRGMRPDPAHGIIRLGPPVHQGGVDAFLWYEVKTGVLVKEEVKTDKGETLKSIINKTNIEGLAPKQRSALSRALSKMIGCMRLPKNR